MDIPRKAVVIKRSEWLRGEGTDPSRLLRSSDGKMCCVGQICLQEGITKEQINERNSLGNLHDPEVGGEYLWRSNKRLAAIHRNCCTPLGYRTIYSTNDVKDVFSTEAAREAELIESLAACGYDVTFED